MGINIAHLSPDSNYEATAVADTIHLRPSVKLAMRYRMRFLIMAITIVFTFTPLAVLGLVTGDTEWSAMMLGIGVVAMILAKVWTTLSLRYARIPLVVYPDGRIDNGSRLIREASPIATVRIYAEVLDESPDIHHLELIATDGSRMKVPYRIMRATEVKEATALAEWFASVFGATLQSELKAVPPPAAVRRKRDRKKK